MFHQVVALGAIKISGLIVDVISIVFSISLILPNLSFVVSLILCSQILSKLTSTSLLFCSVFTILLKFGLEKDQL
jgi:hypothetical protein